jgi:sulfur-oxidizing protein SoxX
MNTISTGTASPLSHGERVGVRGYGLSKVLHPLTRICRFAPNPTSPGWGEVKKRAFVGGLVVWLVTSVALLGAAAAQVLQPYAVTGDAIPASLTGAPGNATRGRALVLNRTSTCILCHSGPFPEEKFQGDLAPDLAGSGSRWSESQLRLRIVDASRLNPATIMPSYYRIDGLTRVGPAWRGKPILSAEQIEDIVAYLVTLRQ